MATTSSALTPDRRSISDWLSSVITSSSSPSEKISSTFTPALDSTLNFSWKDLSRAVLKKVGSLKLEPRTFLTTSSL